MSIHLQEGLFGKDQGWEGSLFYDYFDGEAFQ